ERLAAPVVKVRRRLRHVAQAWHFELVSILFAARDIEAAEIGFARSPSALREEVAHDADTLKEVAAEVPALMARDAAEPREQLVALDRVRPHGTSIPGEVPVERCIDRDQRAQVFRDRALDGLRIGLCAEYRLEALPHRPVGAQTFLDRRPVRAQLERALHRLIDLLLEARRAPVPELRHVERAIE